MLPVVLPPLRSWNEFLDAAMLEPTTSHASSRRADYGWHGAPWEEALQLAMDGWSVPLEETDVTVGELRESAGLSHAVTLLEPTWDVTGSEVDVGAYLSGVPECMVDAVPRQISRRGKVITFLVPGGYSNTIGHYVIINRGLALAALCTAIIDAGHSVEIWSGFCGTLHVSKMEQRFSGVARVIAAGEPFDVGRLIFAVAHPAMLRRLWFGVWDAQPKRVAAAMQTDHYGGPPYTCQARDLPEEIHDPYVFPYLTETDRQWDDLPSALAWARQMFRELELIQE
ncbi:hypothetical protein ATK36_2951 [Amycolatopsis sulphurea]|uniref:DUF7192 domain-containing protein n=1 Tax=Amycolatopsis sulphurea TaxID=76022 RepID=A0A2A9FBL6_9PSEU|nr:hypothetical protein [Amycolatopsis sulphurea]PFG47890.1 hypothetical protein ATK36_2951 [Amycolatopsis sulphurea]